MKWWYVILILVGVGIGLGLLRISFLNKQGEMTSFVGEVDNPVKITTDYENKEVETEEIVGVVEAWNYKEGKLEIKENRESRSFLIEDLEKTMMMVNSLKEKGRELLIKNKDNPNWIGGFCEGDQVVVRVKGEEVIMAVNNGPRTCGFGDL